MQTHDILDYVAITCAMVGVIAAIIACRFALRAIRATSGAALFDKPTRPFKPWVEPEGLTPPVRHKPTASGS